MLPIIIHNICVCGAGTMGSGIAQVAAIAGYTTILFDVNNEALARGKASIKANLQRLEEKGKLSEAEETAALQRLSFTGNIQECKSELVIEAIIENKQAKLQLLSKLAEINGEGCIYASNTSSISIKEIAEGFTYPAMLVGMHFFNPAPVMKLVEVVKTGVTNEAAINAVMVVAKQMGKTPVLCNEAPGFIVNRVARPYYLEAMKLLEDGLADIETIDTVMEATGFKMGPFKLMDLIGLDVNYQVSNIVWDALGKPERLTPSPLQKQKVEAGELGKKSGRGWRVS